MADSHLWEMAWVLAAIITGAVMFGAWTGPHRSVSNLSRWAVRLHIRRVPVWLSARAADRWAFRGGLVSLVLLLAAAWLIPSQRAPEPPVGVPGDAGKKAPDRPVIERRPDRHLDEDLKTAIRVHVPKGKKIRIVVLSGDSEADQIAWEIDAFLKAEGYTGIAPHLLFAMAAGGQTPSGTTMYPDENDPNILVIRIGLNDRS
jgi:hypothetical protein